MDGADSSDPWWSERTRRRQPLVTPPSFGSRRITGRADLHLHRLLGLPR